VSHSSLARQGHTIDAKYFGKVCEKKTDCFVKSDTSSVQLFGSVKKAAYYAFKAEKSTFTADKGCLTSF
jgi:hypothetical protein